MAANEPVDKGVADSSFSWWRPRPSSIIGALLVGSALAVMLNVDHELGKPPTRRYGWPFINQVEPHEGVRAVSASWFNPGRLAVDVVISAVILASAYCTAQWLAYRLFGPSRYTVHSLLLTIAAVAVLLAVYKLGGLWALFVFSGAFIYGLISPLLLAAILLFRWYSSGCGST